MYNITHDDIYEWIKDNREHFDLSESVRLDMLDTTNKQVLGKFKYEIHGLVMTDFVSLNPKMRQLQPYQER
ncbi:MAG: hypothetical protein ACKPKO_26775 [Candidatus Fonsibacter sp.]